MATALGIVRGQVRDRGWKPDPHPLAAPHLPRSGEAGHHGRHIARGLVAIPKPRTDPAASAARGSKGFGVQLTHRYTGADVRRLLMRRSPLSCVGLTAIMVLTAGAQASAQDLPPPRPPLIVLPVPPPVPPVTGFGEVLSGRSLYWPMVAAEAKRHDLPAEIADAVMRVESGYNTRAIGADGERGLMQVMPPTAALLGFKGTREELAEPETNIRLGVRYLAGAWKLADGNLCRALMKYRAGHNEERMSALSVAYCRRAKAHLASIGSPFAGGAVPEVDFQPGGRVRTSILVLRPVTAGPTGGEIHEPRSRIAMRRGPKVRTEATSRRFWAAHEAKIKAIEARLPWKRDRIATGF